MASLVFPDYPFRMRMQQGRRQIFDELRRRWVVLTPEEWVRQHFLHYMTRQKNYPAAFIAVEKAIRLGELTKRFDILVYNSAHQPWLMVECKSNTIPLSDATVHQLLGYNMAVPVSFLAVSNGGQHYFFARKSEGLVAMEDLPHWEEQL